MKLRLLSVFVWLGLSLLASPAAVPEVTVIPASQSIQNGGTASVDLWISNLGIDRLGAWDVTLAYDPVLAALNSVTFGDYLSPSFQDFSVTSPGWLNLTEVSFMPPETLRETQPDSFRLATITFDGLRDGTFNVGLDYVSLSDAYGNTIPEAGSTLSLLAMAGLGLAGLRRFFR